jgi:hypothetical protein
MPPARRAKFRSAALSLTVARIFALLLDGLLMCFEYRRFSGVRKQENVTENDGAQFFFQ